MTSNDKSSMSSDLSSQEIVVNQIKDKIKNFESFLKSRENVLNVFQSKFNELKSEHKSKELTLETSVESKDIEKSMETREAIGCRDLDSKLKTREELRFRGKLLLLKRQLRHSLALIERQKGEKESIERVLQELKDKRIEYETKEYNKVMRMSCHYKTAEEDNIVKQKVEMKVYPKNSMDRFGDDLTEEMISRVYRFNLVTPSTNSAIKPLL